MLSVNGGGGESFFKFSTISSCLLLNGDVHLDADEADDGDGDVDDFLRNIPVDNLVDVVGVAVRLVGVRYVEGIKQLLLLLGVLGVGVDD